MKPFRGILYNAARIRRMKDVMAPPYDVISPAMQAELYRASPYNIVRLILGKEAPADNGHCNKYTRAKGFFSNWLAAGILAQDTLPAIYAYRQDYKEYGAWKTRLGFIALMKLEGFSREGILPHENTFKGPKEDRFSLISEVKANLSPIFSLYKDPGHLINKTLSSQVKKAKPHIDVSLDGTRHRVWRLIDNEAIKKIESAMRRKTAFIADGHHRYEVALRYRDEMRRASGGRPGPYDYVMMYFADMDPKAMTVFATHRIIKDAGDSGVEEIIDRLKGRFTVRELGSRQELLGWLKKSRDLSREFGLYMDRKAYVLRLKSGRFLSEMDVRGKSRQWKALDVSILHHLILKKVLDINDAEGSVVYTRKPEDAILCVDRGDCKLAFLLNPTKVSQVATIATKGELMPHKSTYFYPKLLSGLVINRLTG